MTQPCQTSTGTPLASGDDLLAGLRAEGPRHEHAIRELHALLLRATRFEIGRRAGALTHIRGEDVADLALQAADDAFVAVMGKLDEFRGDSRFSTWAYKFALYEAAVRVRRRAWQHREVVMDPDSWLTVGDPGAGPAARVGQTELLDAIRQLIATDLTPHQRDVLVALTIQDIPIDVLAERLDSTRGALYKTLHDARRRLRRHLVAAGHDLQFLSP
ncbi:MAG TPA: sigma-70 family RNA polymerase sigma factor [Baekduia sp.]|jgi:RNA polymerase sigma-70 factor (ECF subfamily)|nr:sigma-70 family RNA polymerase sigma factor [Baekduia sp.]